MSKPKEPKKESLSKNQSKQEIKCRPDEKISCWKKLKDFFKQMKRDAVAKDKLRQLLEKIKKKDRRKMPLHFAAEKGLLDICQLLFSKGAQIDSLDYKQYTPLHWAARNGHMAVTDYLLEKGANPSLGARLYNGRTPLHFAAAAGKLDICQLLCFKGVHIDILDNNNFTPLHWAAKNGHMSVTDYLLEKGANPSLRAKLYKGRTPLHFAAAAGKLDICQLLCSKGVHIDILDNNNFTPLHLALRNGHISLADYLLEKGANPNLGHDGKISIPIHLAAAAGKLDICQLLFSKGAHIDILDNNNFTPLHWAAKNGHISVADYLLEKGASPNFGAKLYNGTTPLHLASAEGTLDICQLLVSKGAHIDAIDDRRLTPLHWAAKRGQVSVAYYLLEKGANLNLKSDENGQKLTPLHYAAVRGKLDMCQLLVSKGAQIYSLDSGSFTPSPIHYAAAAGELEIFQFLLSKGAHIDFLDNGSYIPLHWAAKEGDISVTNFSLEKGVNLNFKLDNWENSRKLQFPIFLFVWFFDKKEDFIGEVFSVLTSDNLKSLVTALSRKDFVTAARLLQKRAVSMIVFSILFKFVFNHSHTLKSLCRFTIVNYICQTKLYYSVGRFNIPECLRSYLAFEEELRIWLMNFNELINNELEKELTIIYWSLHDVSCYFKQR
ncbi:ankyrin-1-like [Artemia franciscana]